jgi:hypothetical protein
MSENVTQIVIEHHLAGEKLAPKYRLLGCCLSHQQQTEDWYVAWDRHNIVYFVGISYRFNQKPVIQNNRSEWLCFQMNKSILCSSFIPKQITSVDYIWRNHTSVTRYWNDLNRMNCRLIAVTYKYSSRIQVSFATDSVKSQFVYSQEYSSWWRIASFCSVTWHLE